MKCEVKWQSPPREVRRALSPILHKWLWLVPAWCRELHVSFENSDDADCPASLAAQPEYRQVHLYIHQGWLLEDDEAREFQIIHELCHVLLAPAACFIEGVVTKVFNTESAGKLVVDEQWRMALESTVQDLALAVRRK